MKKHIIILLSAASVLAMKSCYYDVAEELYPCTASATVTYSTTIEPVISANCYACHATAVAAVSGDNIVLEGYASLKKKVDDGRLLCAIKHEGGCSPMPKGQAKLGSCTIADIEKWVEEGAPDN